jgi:hypothetical protein
MTAMPQASEIIITVNSNIFRGCPLCNSVPLDGSKGFDEACNHLLQTHGLKCLHVGQETINDGGKPWETTVAVFGK